VNEIDKERDRRINDRDRGKRDADKGKERVTIGE